MYSSIIFCAQRCCAPNGRTKTNKEEQGAKKGRRSLHAALRGNRIQKHFRQLTISPWFFSPVVQRTISSQTLTTMSDFLSIYFLLCLAAVAAGAVNSIAG